ncbi:putative glutamine transport system permease protein [Streptococcus pneumoniae]|nr:putative glutamine transport system permease protein [Streptococcus pneumoniae]
MPQPIVPVEIPQSRPFDSKKRNDILLKIRIGKLEVSFFHPNHSYLSQLDVTYKTPDLMSHFLPPHEVSFTFCCSSIVFPR